MAQKKFPNVEAKRKFASLSLFLYFLSPRFQLRCVVQMLLGIFFFFGLNSVSCATSMVDASVLLGQRSYGLMVRC